MAVKVILNGYFRSGTSFLYKALKSNLKNHVSFYEPLHHRLGLIINTTIEGDIDDVHQQRITDEYHRLSFDAKKKLLLNHPNTTLNGIQGERALLDYISLYNDMKSNVFLQTNRMHFYLDVVREEYDAKVIHIVRHPLDVYNSMKNTSFRDTGFKRFIEKFFKIRNMYELEKDFYWCLRHTGKPKGYYHSWKIRFFDSKFSFKKFVAVWIIANYYAIKTLEEKGLVCAYEKILENPDKEFKRISDYLGVSDFQSPDVKKGNCYKFSKKQADKFIKTTKEMGLEAELAYITKNLKVNYFK